MKRSARNPMALEGGDAHGDTGPKAQAHGAQAARGQPRQAPAQRQGACPAPGRAQMPGVAPAGSQKEWKRLAPALEAMGVLTMADLTAFEGYCQAYARWKEAEAFITQHGSIFQTPSGYVQQVPQVSIAQQNLKIMQSFCSEFGLTPATRARIIAGGGSEDGASEDPMERLLKGEW